MCLGLHPRERTVNCGERLAAGAAPMTRCFCGLGESDGNRRVVRLCALTATKNWHRAFEKVARQPGMLRWQARRNDCVNRDRSKQRARMQSASKKWLVEERVTHLILKAF